MEVVVIGGSARLSESLLAALATRGERAVHLPDGAGPQALTTAHALVNLAADAEQLGALVASLSQLPASLRPLVLVDASGDAESGVVALRAQRLGARVVALDPATMDGSAAATVGLILHALRAWDLTGQVDAATAERSGYRAGDRRHRAGGRAAATAGTPG